MNAAVVVLAGGSGARLGGSENKVFLAIGGRPILSWSLQAVGSCPGVERLVVVCRPEDRRRVEEICGHSAAEIIDGGASRHESESNGIEALAGAGLDVIAVHDAARPLVTTDLTRRVIEAAHEVGGAIPFLPLGLPLFSNGALLDSSAHVRVQTPQAFRAQPLIEAFRQARVAGFEGVDTAETVERFADLEVALVPGDAENLKITYPADLLTAELSVR